MAAEKTGALSDAPVFTHLFVSIFQLMPQIVGCATYEIDLVVIEVIGLHSPIFHSFYLPEVAIFFAGQYQ